MDRNNSLDSLRFLAALCVAVAHCLTAFSTQPFHAQTLSMMNFSNVEGVFARLIQLLFNAHSAVIIFFVLSGFVLTLSLQRLSSVNYGVEFFVFVIRRVYRIFPALICSLLILGFMISYPSEKLVQNMLLMDTSINSVAWTLKVELAGCVVVFLGFAVHRLFRPGLVFLGLALALLYFSGLISPIYAKYLPAFFIGSLITYARKDVVVGPYVSHVGLLLMLVSDMAFGYKSDTSIIVQTICAGILILSISRSGFMPWLNRPVLTFLGKISFSFYLMHLIGMILTRQLCVKLGIPLGGMSMIGNAAVYAAISVSLTIAISAITYYLVEQPMNKVGSDTASSFRKMFLRRCWTGTSTASETQPVP
ncbi:acyltransferase [Pseudomonas sp. RGM2987]|uniref:acyltransferase family protein n=1 Tax=Pseudomonas sp. RGM2987 TaxID=2930090 RepID=UPI001FD63F02|nr:acyltransferase [Pseudomonas sp. RGM2987]MCJ8206864.1 acyltransferase [Pseudomonas sp. RGM2987]